MKTNKDAYETVSAIADALPEGFSPLDFLLAGGAVAAADGPADPAPRAPVADHEKCRKCGGTGHLSHYRHVANGVCFACDGSGKDGYARA